MSVNAMIANGIWWTIGLLGTATLISWVLGILLGTLGGYFPNRWWAKLLEGTVIVIYPIPYFIIAFTLLMLFTYFLPIFRWWAALRARPALASAISAASSGTAFCPPSP
jgi:peptide/nickel transport system permease protein